MEQIPAKQPQTADQVPDYLHLAAPLPAWSLRLIEASDTRRLTSRAEELLAREVAAACSRVRSVRVDRDGRD